MKRKLAPLFLGVILCGLTACGSQTDTADVQPVETEEPEAVQEEASINTAVDESGEDEAQLSFMWWGNEIRAERTKEALSLYSQNNPGVSFDTQDIKWADYWTTLQDRAEKGDMPDIVQLDYTFLDQCIEEELLVDLTPYIRSGELDLSGVAPGVINAASIGGKIYGVASGVNAPALLYNKTLLDELNIAITDNMTLEEFYEVARQVYEKTGIKTDLPYKMTYNYMPYILRAADVTKLFGYDSFNVDTENLFEEYFSIYETGVQEGWIVEKDVHENQDSTSVKESPMVCFTTPQTQSWCGFFWSNQLSAMINEAPEEMEIGMTTWPSANPQKSNYLKPSGFYAISADAGEKEAAAVRVVNYLLNSVPANEILLAERGIPASSAVADAIAPYLDETEQRINTFIEEVVTPNSSDINSADPVQAEKIYQCADVLIDKILTKEITAQQAAQQLYQQGNEILKESSQEK